MQEDQQAESYWRVRASELRAELAAVNGRINLVQTRLNALPLNYSFGGFVGVPNFVSVNQLSRGVAFPTVFLNGKVSGPIRRGGLSMGFGNTHFHGRVGFDNFQRRGFNRRGFLPPFGSLVALPFDAYDSSFERATLLTELNQLLSQRAGLQSRWRSLEDDARRSGAYPGWLR
jgi:hypothetical protein